MSNMNRFPVPGSAKINPINDVTEKMSAVSVPLAAEASDQVGGVDHPIRFLNTAIEGENWKPGNPSVASGQSATGWK